MRVINSRAVTPSEHLLAWFTPARRKLISTRALDAEAGAPLGTFSRFLKGERHVTFRRSGLARYYPALQLLGYVPPDISLIPPDSDPTP